jgi:alpha-beta hydrolase superfamily lysophospholipase
MQMRQDVRFYSEGSAVAGHLYLPDSAQFPVPGIVLCHGFAGIKELLVPSFAEYFCTKGYAALTFDYRGFGGSEGEPGRLVPLRQIRDIRNAVTFMQSLEKVDSKRIGLWGTSFGGANAIITASSDDRIRCLCVQLTFGDGSRVVTGNMSEEEKTKFFATLQKMQEKKVLTGKEMMVSIHKVLSDPQSKAFFESHVSQFPHLNIKIPFLTVAETLEHKPEKFLRDLRIPIHIVAAGKDGVNPPQESLRLFEAASDPKELSIIEDASHYEVYQGDFFERVVGRQTAWFDRYL